MLDSTLPCDQIISSTMGPCSTLISKLFFIMLLIYLFIFHLHSCSVLICNKYKTGPQIPLDVHNSLAPTFLKWCSTEVQTVENMEDLSVHKDGLDQAMRFHYDLKFCHTAIQYLYIYFSLCIITDIHTCPHTSDTAMCIIVLSHWRSTRISPQ